ncbi:hypothetical protein PT974_03420 [Cladobotryum mycophilum]|uniref:Uncharacterized protein n=1 Tax=Cladobotryum mycophilum TaxID=491253 RepID=A0ABR0SSD5_9HYPO
MSLAIRSLSRASPSCAASLRRYYTSPKTQSAYKDTQDRNTVKPTTDEGTRSGRDEDVSKQHDASYNPSKTKPETERDTAGVGNEINPLEASGANQEFSKPMGNEKEAHDTGPGKETRKGGRVVGIVRRRRAVLDGYELRG